MPPQGGKKKPSKTHIRKGETEKNYIDNLADQAEGIRQVNPTNDPRWTPEQDTTMTKENVLDWLEKATMLDVKELVDAIEEKFGVTAAAPVMAMAAAPAAAAEEEQTEFDVILTGAGAQKIQVIKVVREITALGLKEAKALVDGAPKAVKEGISREEADDLKTRLTDVGGSVEIK